MQQGKNNPNKFNDEQNSDRLNYLDSWLLLGWFAVSMILRFTNLANQPASSIEIATLGFSLGHSFAQVPLEQVISASTLLSPLQVDFSINSTDVVHRLLTESTHPPLYFWLTHWWIELFCHDGELVSLQVGRSLSAVFGGLAIPAIFGMSWLAWRDRLTAHLSAVLMTFSPYGIYLAQEARHYTLSILWIIASLCCLIVAIEQINRRRKMRWSIVLTWIGINSLGIATHYFFALALVIEFLIVLGFWFGQRDRSKQLSFDHWLPLINVGCGTLVGCLVWLPVISGISSNELTEWIETSYSLNEIWQPLPRMTAWLISMIVLLPIEGVPIAIAICSGIIILLALIWVIPTIIQRWKLSLNNPRSLSIRLLTGYLFGTVILYLLLIYGYGKDISLAARYHFVYFPVIILVLSAILAKLWHTPTEKEEVSDRQWFYSKGKQVVAVVLLMSLLGSLTVINDLGFKKSKHSDLMAEHIQEVSTVPTIVATTYETLSQLRELIALALSLQTSSLSDVAPTSQFLLMRRNEYHNFNLNEILAPQPKPLDLWGINLKSSEDALIKINCTKDNESKLSNSGYTNHLYHCY